MTVENDSQNAESGTSESTNTTSNTPPAETLDGLRKELTEARNEAGKYRQRAREFADDETYKRAKEAVKKLEEAEQAKKSEVEKLSEQNAQLLFQSAESEKALLRLRAALNAGIEPTQVDEFAARLQGTTEDELKTDAEKLAKFFTPAKRGDRSQGAGAEGNPTLDPIQEKLMNKLGITF